MRQRSRTRRLLALLLGLSVLAAACGDDDDTEAEDEDTTETTAEEEEEPTADPIAALQETGDADPSCEAESDGAFNVGGLLAETGDLGDILGAPQIAGAQLAVADVNAAGGVLDQDLSFDQKDSGDEDPDLATPAVDEHLQAGVDAILGASASGISANQIDTIVSSCTIMFSPSNTGPLFTTYADDDLYFRTASADILQGRVLAELAIADGAATAAILARQDPYGEGLQQFIEEPFVEAGGEVVVSRAYDPEGGDFSAEVEEVVTADPDALFMVGFDESAQILGDLIESDFTPQNKQIYWVEGNMTAEISMDPGALVGIRGTIPGAEVGGEFQGRLLEQNPNLGSFTYGPETYDAVVILALAAEAAGTDQADEVARQINGITRDGTKCTSYQECKDLLAQGEDIDYDGQSGPLDFARPGEPAAASYGIYGWNEDNTLNTDDVEFRDVSIS